ncbi:MAG: DUF4168 domain-containing protein [Desulfurivibrio sp.]|nr:DUF4168 domain-containing protein [Desulfurivibrio sp.]
MSVRATVNQKILGGALILLLGLAIPGLALAMPEQGQPQQQDFDQATLQNFADASVELQSIQEEYAGRLEGVQDQDKAIEIQQQANKEMVGAVKDVGLDVQTYNAIANQMNTDPELNEQVLDLIKQAR